MPAGRRSAQQTPCQVSTQRMTPSALAIKLHFSQHLRRIVCIQCSQLPLLCCQRSARLVLQSVWLKCPCVRAHSMAYSIVSVLVCVVRSRQDTLYAITILLRWGACVVPVVGFLTRCRITQESFKNASETLQNVLKRQEFGDLSPIFSDDEFATWSS